MLDRSTLVQCARNAVNVAAICVAGVILTGLVRGPGARSPLPVRHAWASVVLAAAVVFAGVFVVFFLFNLISRKGAQRIYDILDEETQASELMPEPLYGFVAMEFYWLILNRTFLVIAGPDGPYGYKVQGPVTNANRRYFETYQEMLQDQDFMRDLPCIRRLAALPGGFFYPAAQIASVVSDDRSQWVMGGIPCMGHVIVRLASGIMRKLIVLGEVIPEEARDRITAALATGIPSRV
jgi:hypothetical protein